VLGGRAAFLTLPVWVVVFSAYGLYNRRELTAGSEEARRLFRAVTVSAVAVVMVTFALKISVPRGWILTVSLLGLVLVGLGRFAVRDTIRRLSVRGFLATSALIVGTNDEARTIARSLARNGWLSYGVLGFVSVSPDHPATVDGRPVLGSVSRISDIVLETGAGAVIISGTAVGADALIEIDQALQPFRVEVRLSPGLPHVSPSRITVRPLDGLALLSLDRRELRRWDATVKRAFDLLGATVLMFPALPVMGLLAALVRFTSPGPAFFRQDRVGKDGKAFRMYKIRSMVADAEDRLEELALEHGDDGVLFKMRLDPRVTRLGAVLRRWGLDELPQLLNVIKGEMSLVGPRPALPRETARYTDRIRARLRVKPGLTGLWQVNGRHELSFDDYIRYDLFYVENWSIGLDLYVIGKTLPAMLTRRGSY
jgi:exopolysaccharide biosynthesis polyprenyl glycosylphosphotransferase